MVLNLVNHVNDKHLSISTSHFSNLLEKVCQNSTNSDNKHEMSFINGHRVNPQISRIHVVVCVTYALVQDAEVSGSKFGSTWDYLS